MDGIKFTVRMKVAYLADVDGKYETKYATKKFVTHNYDDLQNLLLTLIKSSDDSLTLTIDKEKEEVSE